MRPLRAWVVCEVVGPGVGREMSFATPGSVEERLRQGKPGASGSERVPGEVGLHAPRGRFVDSLTLCGTTRSEPPERACRIVSAGHPAVDFVLAERLELRQVEDVAVFVAEL